MTTFYLSGTPDGLAHLVHEDSEEWTTQCGLVDPVTEPAPYNEFCEACVRETIACFGIDGLQVDVPDLPLVAIPAILPFLGDTDGEA